MVSGATLGNSIICIIAIAAGVFLKNLLFTISSGLGGLFLYQLVFRSQVISEELHRSQYCLAEIG